VRRRGDSSWQPLHEFFAQRAYLARDYPEAQETLASRVHEDWKREHWQFITKAFEAMTATPPSAATLRHVFNELGGSDYEFQEFTFPDVDDFVNLPPHHAFCRRERAENLVLFRAAAPNEATKDEKNRAALFDLFARQAEERRRATELQKALVATVAAADAEPVVAEESPATGKVSAPLSPEAHVARTAAPRREPQLPRPPRPRPTLLGKGGAKHKYLQDFVKRMAESKGFRAVIEEPVLNGTGSIDVALFKGDQKVACEISVSSTLEQERGNVAKCREAGYESIIVIAPEAKDIRKLEPMRYQRSRLRNRSCAATRSRRVGSRWRVRTPRHGGKRLPRSCCRACGG